MGAAPPCDGRCRAGDPRHRLRSVTAYAPWSRAHHRTWKRFSLLATACSSTSSADEAKEKSLAEQLVSAAKSAGVAPGLTVEQSPSRSTGRRPRRSATCSRAGVSSAEVASPRPAIPSGRREKLITTDAVTYERSGREDLLPGRTSRPTRTSSSDIDANRDRPASHRRPVQSSYEIRTQHGTSRRFWRAAASTPRRRSGSPVALMAWPALAMMMVASVGSIAQLSDSATFGLGAVTVYLIPAVLFLLPVGSGLGRAGDQPRGRDLRLGPGGVRRPDRLPGHLVRLHEQRHVVPLVAVLRRRRARDRLRPAGPRRQRALHGRRGPGRASGLATFVVSKGMKTTAGLSNIGVGLGHHRPGLRPDLLHVRLADRRASRRRHRWTWSAITPPFDGLSSIALVVGTFVAFAGLEVNAVHIKHLKGRPRSYFKAVLLGGRAGLRDVHARVDRDLGGRARRHPRAHLRCVAGLHRLRRRVRHPGPFQRACRGCWCWARWPPRSPGSPARAAACGWSVAPATCRSRFQKVNKNDVQMPILLFQGVIVTILSLVFVVAPNTSVAFAMLQDVSIILYMGMYICMFASAIKLRRSQPDVDRPIRITGLPVIACVGIARRAVGDRARPHPAGRLHRRLGGRCMPRSSLAGVVVLAIPAQLLLPLPAAGVGQPSTRPKSSPSQNRA